MAKVFKRSGSKDFVGRAPAGKGKSKFSPKKKSNDSSEKKKNHTVAQTMILVLLKNLNMILKKVSIAIKQPNLKKQE